MQARKGVILFVLLGLLAFANTYIWYAASVAAPDSLRVVFLQSGAVYIKAPSGTSMLINTGPDKRVLRELSGVMPFYEHSINILVATDASRQSIGGASWVLKRYSVAKVVEPQGIKNTPADKSLEQEIGTGGITRIYEKRGTRFNLGGGAVFDVLSSGQKGSLVGRFAYGKTSFLILDNAATSTRDRLLAQYGNQIKSTVIASENMPAKNFIQKISPSEIIIAKGGVTDGGAYQVKHLTSGAVTFDVKQ